jgi:hypothetical protein
MSRFSVSPEGHDAHHEEQRIERKVRRGVQRNMGMVRYYLLPCLRSIYKDPEEEPPPLPGPDKSLIKKMREDEYKRLKNPDTIAHHEYKKLIAKNPKYVPNKLAGGEKNRRNRADDRRERKQKRREDPYLNS